MKQLIPFLVFLILVSSISASHIFVNIDKLAEGDAKAYETDEGIYIVQLLVVSDGQEAAKFKVNGEISDTIKVGESFEFKDGSIIILRQALVIGSANDKAEYYFYGSGNNPIPVSINTDRFDMEECNFDNTCQDNETKKNCCYDCGCEARHKCEDNECIRKEGCISNEDCDDEKACTTDVCANNKCAYTPINGCEFNNKCLEFGTIKNIDNTQSYCLDNKWKPQKAEDKPCQNSYQCLSGECKNKECYVRSYKSVITTIILVILGIIIIYSCKKFQLIKKFKRYLFWK